MLWPPNFPKKWVSLPNSNNSCHFGPKCDPVLPQNNDIWDPKLSESQISKLEFSSRELSFESLVNWTLPVSSWAGRSFSRPSPSLNWRLISKDETVWNSKYCNQNMFRLEFWRTLFRFPNWPRKTALIRRLRFVCDSSLKKTTATFLFTTQKTTTLIIAKTNGCTRTKTLIFQLDPKPRQLVSSWKYRWNFCVQ